MRVRPISVGAVVKNMTLMVEVPFTGVRWFRCRFWLGARLIALAALVIGCGIEVKPPQHH